MSTLAELKKLLQAGSPPGLILLYGEESYFLEEGTRLLVDGLLEPGDRDFNFNQYRGKDFRAAEVVEQARTLPVFAPRRLVLLRHLHEATAEQLDGLVAYLDDPVPETVLLMTAAKIDARRKFFQRLRKVGQLYEFKKIYDNQLPSFVRDLAKQSGFQMTAGALKLFSKRVGTNLVEVRGEMEKLHSYLGERDLAEEEDVASVVSDTRVESIFDLTAALGEGDCSQALNLLRRLMSEGQAPLMILAMITRHYRQMWKTSELVAQNTPQKELPRKVGINPYFLKGLVEQARRYDSRGYQEIFRALLAADLALKSTGADPEAQLQGLVFSVAGTGAAKK